MAVSGATFAAPGGNVPSGFLGALFAGFLGGFVRFVHLMEESSFSL